MKVIAIDVGGTKLAVAIVDCNGSILAARKSPVEKACAEATAEQIASEADAVRREAGLSWSGIAAAGVVVPGILDSSNRTAWAPNLWGDREVAFGAYLARRLQLPLHIEGDRAGYVLGERWLGVARGLDDVVFVAIGTGIGAGIIADGRLIRGAAGASGAVGWMAMNSGRWEDEGAGPAVARAGERGHPGE